MLAFGLPLTQTLLLANLSLEMLLAPTQTLLLLPGLRPPLIQECQTHGEHGIDMLGFPMHTRAFETGLDDPFVAALDTSRANRPA